MEAQTKPIRSHEHSPLIPIISDFRRNGYKLGSIELDRPLIPLLIYVPDPNDHWLHFEYVLKDR